MKLFVIVTVIAASLILTALGKNEDKTFLSKCSCGEERDSVICDFSSLPKKKLLKLIEVLMKSEILCVSAEQYWIPTFSRKLISSSALQQDMEIEVFGLPTPSKKESSASKSAKSQSKKKDVPKSPEKPSAVVSSNNNSHLNCVLDGMSCNTKDNLYFLFPTPILIHDIARDPISRKHNAALKEMLLDLEEEDDGCKFKLHGGYRSKDGFLKENDDALKWLREQIHPRIHHLLSLANASSIPYELDGWGQVLRAGDGHSIHVHPGSMYAGVYYISAPAEIDLNRRGEGCLEFFDPRNGASMAQVTRGKTIYGEAIQVCPPMEGGTLVIFPSWLDHEVKPLPAKVSAPRIAISFNINYRPE